MNVFACRECGAPAGVPCAAVCLSRVEIDTSVLVEALQVADAEPCGATALGLCLGCGDLVTEDVAADTCGDHVMCVGCEDPRDRSCPECNAVRRDIAADHAGELAGMFARESRAA